MLIESEGEIAVRLARKAIQECIGNRKKIEPDGLPPVFREKRGVFVTLNKRSNTKELRAA